MRKSITINKMRRGPGRPPQGPFVGARLPQELIDQIDAWAARECDNSRSEAIRRLLERALAAEQSAKPRRPASDEKDRAAGRSIREARVALEHSREKIERALAAIGLVERGLASEPDATKPRRPAKRKQAPT
jgi:Arc/MetJ-type ribon-helix-helix transcriptional regulator